VAATGEFDCVDAGVNFNTALADRLHRSAGVDLAGSIYAAPAPDRPRWRGCSRADSPGCTRMYSLTRATASASI